MATQEDPLDFLKKIRGGILSHALREFQRSRRVGPGEDAQEEHWFYQWRPYVERRSGRPSFQSHVMNSEARYLFAATANQVGKTNVGARWVARNALCEEPLFAAFRVRPSPTKGWVVTEADLVQGLMKEVLEFVPPWRIKRIHRAKGEEYIEIDNGSIIEFKTYSQDRTAFQQAKIDYIWFDEEPPQHIWTECRTRLIKKKGQALFTFTPLQGLLWLHELMGGEDPQYENALTGRIAHFRGAMIDNPHLPLEEVQEYIENFDGDDDELQIRVYGKFILAQGECPFDAETLRRNYEVCREPTSWISLELEDERGSIRAKPSPASPRDGIAIWEEPIEGVGYVIGADVAEGGEESDYCDARVMKVRGGEFVASFRQRNISPTEFGRLLLRLGAYYNNALICHEFNNNGWAVLDPLTSSGYPAIYRRQSTPGKPKPGTQFGFRTDRWNKPLIVRRFAQALREGRVKLCDAHAINEMRRFVQFRKEGKASKCGYGACTGNDDAVISHLLALEAAGSPEARVTVLPTTRSDGLSVMDRIANHVARTLKARQSGESADAPSWDKLLFGD